MIYLKNGSIIKGTILEESLETIKLETYDGSIWVFDQAEVVKVGRQQASPKAKETTISTPASPWRVQMDIAMLPGKTPTQPWSGEGIDEVAVSLQGRIGYRVHRLANVGVGAGIDAYYATAVVPHFVSVSSDLAKGFFTPSLALDWGWGRPLVRNSENVDHQGGMYFSPTFGLKKYSRNNQSAFQLKIGYRSQHVTSKWTQPNWWGWWPNGAFNENRYRYQRLVFGFSLEF